MYWDTLEYAKNCPQCVIVKRTGRKQKLPLHPISTKQPFQIVVDNIIIEFPVTTRDNKYVVVFQDLFMQWFILATSDQKAERIACLIVKEIILFLLYQKHSI